MKVKFLSACACPGYAFSEGQIGSVPDEDARVFIEGGYAVAVEEEKPATEPEEEVQAKDSKTKESKDEKGKA